MKKYILLYLVLLLFLDSSICQDDHFNTQKYWNLRKRLNEKFVSVGLEHGQSLVAQNVHTGAQCCTGNHHYGMIGGDILLNQGWYIAVLATEFHLLRVHNLSTKKTEEELYYALKAVDRLDHYAEDLSNYFFDYTWNENQGRYEAFINPETSNLLDEIPESYNVPWQNNGYYADNLNGFLIRDDIPPGFYNRFNGIYTQSNFTCAVDHFTRSIPETDDEIIRISSCDEMSQDQLIHLLMGLKFVVSYVDPFLEVDGYNLVENATKQAYRLFMQYFWNEHAIINLDYNIINPATQRQVLRGPTSINYIYPIAETVKSIIYQYPGFYLSLQQNAAFNVAFALAATYHPFWYAPYLSDWWALTQSIGPKPNASMNLHMALCLAAISNSWYTAPIDVSRLKMYGYGSMNNQQKEIYYLMSRALYNLPTINNYFSVSDIKSVLNGMCCEGPYRFHKDEENKYDYDQCNGRWNRNNSAYEYSYLFHPEGVEFFTDGEFPGLDYMLMHNLFYIIHNDEIDTQFENYKDMHVKFQYPRFDDHFLGYTHSQVVTNGNDDNTYQNFENYGNDWVYPVIGSHSNPIFFRAFDEIRFSNVVKWNGNLTAQAGKALIWDIPGFEVEPGGFFEAYIQPVQCNTINGFHRLSLNDSNYYLNEKLIKESNFIRGKENPTANIISDNTLIMKSNEIYQNLNVYPIPTANLLNIEIPPNNKGLINIAIFDLQGKNCYSKALKQFNESKITIDISDLSEGMYIIQLNTELKSYQSKIQKIKK